jgi:excisionase family DNA binding protein
MAKKQDVKTGGVETVAQTDEYVGTTQAARELGVSQATFRRWMKEGRIEAHRVGKKWRVKRSDLPGLMSKAGGPDVPTMPAVPGLIEKWQRQMDRTMQKNGTTEETIRAQAQAMASQVEQPNKGDTLIRPLAIRMLLNAVHCTASDLHIEPNASDVRVRQRIDGFLTEVVRFPREVGIPLVMEIERWSALNPAERFRPQDGRFTVQAEGRQLDFRVSTAPGVHGPIVAIRVLDPHVALRPMDKLGFEKEQLETWRRCIGVQDGVIIVTGPTGCGKTTTLYDALSALNSPDRKIMTAEDPIELDIPGLNQMQIRPDAGSGFTQLARSMLRQAVDVMFIGEIRDLDTAQLLVQGALTGHLIFTTLHTNDAPSAPVRLIDMGIKPFLVASALRCVLAQRLIRVVCFNCKTESHPEEKSLVALGIVGRDRERVFYRGAGCDRCHNTGYRGRIAVFELMVVDGRVRDAIMKGSATGVREAARASGMRTFREVALAKLFRGETSMHEVVRLFSAEQRDGVAIGG